MAQTTTTVMNAVGLVSGIIDAGGHGTLYGYDAFGDLAQVKDAAGNIISNSFDGVGRGWAAS